jgi:uncharacterized membrane protein YkoI
MKSFALLGISALLLASCAVAADSKMKLSDLPPAVQATVKEQTKNATLGNISKEVEKGKTMYEVESIVNGKSRDLMVDSSGKLLSVEEETTLEAIPAAARAAIQKKVGGGKINKVEILTQGSIVSYEAAYTGKNGKNAEVGFNADGTPHKE